MTDQPEGAPNEPSAHTSQGWLVGHGPLRPGVRRHAPPTPDCRQCARDQVRLAACV